MAVEELIAALEREAERDVAARLERGRTAAEEIERRSAEVAELEISHAAEARTTKERAATEAAAAEARRRLAHALLATKERAVARVLDRARSRIEDTLGSARYAALAPKLRDRARASLGEAEVCFDDAGGIVARSTDGAISVDARLSTRLDKMRPELAIEIVRHIAEDG